MRRLLVSALLLTCLCAAAFGKDSETGLVIFWPNQQNAVLKLTFSKFQELGITAGGKLLQSNVLVQNLSSKPIPSASFSVALVDQDHVRIGDGTLVVSDLEAGQSARVAFTCESLGTPAVLSIGASNKNGLPTHLKTIPMTVISVPAGASLRVDDKDEGLTPARINVGIGTHQLELKKEGFAIATTPLEVAPDEAPGGSITITLGGLSDDTVELRDGTILTGEVESMTLESIVVVVQGQRQKLERNQVKKMFLVERTVTKTVVDPREPVKKKVTSTSSPNP
jgi:hypothetical protein